jgi:hypothetical protein
MAAGERDDSTTSQRRSLRDAVRQWLYLPTGRFRRRRMRRFLELFAPTASTRILDVGGTDAFWRLAGVASDVVLLNIDVPVVPDDLPPNMRYVQADGTTLPFPDRSFDICFSNSTIEHVHTYERQQAFASEMRRVGEAIWLQTPARSFPFEPHWLGFFIHWLPERWQRRLARNFTVWGWVNRPTQEQVDELVDEYRLLTHRELRQLFPDCEIRRERFLGLTKSYVAIRRRSASRSS